MENDTSQSTEEEETKTIRVEDWEDKAEDISNWLNETTRFSRWKIYGSALILAMSPPQAFLLVFAVILYKAHEKGFLFSSRYVKEATVEK